MDEGLKIQDVVARVKEAIRSALDDAEEGGPVLERMDLTIRTVVKRSAGLGISVTVPVVDLKLGVGGDRKEQETRTVSLTLVPPAGRLRGPRAFDDEVVTEVAAAVALVREGVRASAEGEPRFDLKKASAQIAFVVDSSGRLSLLGKRGTESGTAHTIELVFGPSASREEP